jgi:hypothetical protein
VAGVFPIAPDSSRWLTLGVGALFIAGGAAVVVGYGFPRRAGTPRALALAQYVLALIITGLMTAVTGWVAFAPGERQFAANIPFLPSRVVELLGRLAFGVSTVVLLAEPDAVRDPRRTRPDIAPRLVKSRSTAKLFGASNRPL